MMLPNLISVSVMPGCWAEAEVHAASDSKAVRATVLDLITCDPPRLTADFVLFVVGRRLEPGPGTVLRSVAGPPPLSYGAAFQPLNASCPGQIRASWLPGRQPCWSGPGRKARFITPTMKRFAT